MFDVAGGREERHRFETCPFRESCQRLGGGRHGQLGAVPAGEGVEAFDFVPVPAPQLGTGRHVLRPLVEMGVVPAQATRPEPIDEDAVAALVGVVHATDIHLAAAV